LPEDLTATLAVDELARLRRRGRAQQYARTYLTREGYGFTLQSSQRVVPSDKGGRTGVFRHATLRRLAAAELGVPMPRGLVPTLLFAFSAIVFFSLGSFLAARQAAASDTDQIAALRAEIGALKRLRSETGTAGRSTETAVAGMDDQSRAALVAEIK